MKISLFQRLGTLVIAFSGLLVLVPQGVSAAAPPNAVNAGSGRSSTNWAGYVATDATQYTSVSGSWVVPSVTSTISETGDAAWVGIGGMMSDDLIQAGTEAATDGNGHVSYDAWVETLPEFSRVIPLTVSAGDAISVSITEQSAGMWDVSIRDTTSGKSWEDSIAYKSSKSSAEWIEEMPSDGHGFIPLDNFGAISFTGASVTADGVTQNLTQSDAQSIVMRNAQNQDLAEVSPVDDSGAGFMVTRTAAAVGGLASTRPARGSFGWGHHQGGVGTGGSRWLRVGRRGGIGQRVRVMRFRFNF